MKTSGCDAKTAAPVVVPHLAAPTINMFGSFVMESHAPRTTQAAHQGPSISSFVEVRRASIHTTDFRPAQPPRTCTIRRCCSVDARGCHKPYPMTSRYHRSTEYPVYQFIVRISKLLNRRERKQFVGVVVLMLIRSVLEASIILAIFPFIGMLRNPDQLHSIWFLQWIYETLGFNTDRQFLVFAGILLLLLILFVFCRGNELRIPKCMSTRPRCW